MRGLAPRLLFAAVVLAASLALAAPALGAPAVDGIFPLKGTIETNNKIAAGPDGNMWFTQSVGKEVAKITPSGQVEEFDLKLGEAALGIAPGPDGFMWVPTTNKVTKFAPSDPEKTKETFTIATINADGQIVAGPDGLMWVASKESLVHFSTKDPVGSAKSVTFEGKLDPKDIDVAGSLIVVADGAGPTEKPRIATFTTAGVQKDFIVPGEGAPQGVAGGPASGQIAFTAPLAKPEQAGLIAPPNPAAPFELSGDPFGVAYGADQAFWIVQFAEGGLTRLTQGGNRTFLPGLPKETARQVAAGPNNTLWVTLIEKEKVIGPSIARISGLEPPVPPSPPSPPSPQPGPVPSGPQPVVLPQTLLGKQPKKVVTTTGKTASVKFAFSSSTAGAQFECSIGKRVKPKGKKARFVGKGFKGCKSPKSYTLQPGRYRFQVRAVSGSLRDSSPAQFTFKVIHVAPK